MDREILDQTITQLETSITTYEDVQELAALYIVRDHLDAGYSTTTPKTLNSYNGYCTAKRDYQMHLISEDSVLAELSKVCTEMSDLIKRIYSNSDMRKERKQIVNLIETLYTDLCK